MKKYNSLINQLSKDGINYVWYACYGSNINYNRFKKYLNGSKDVLGNDYIEKTEPLEYKKYILQHPIYFAGESKKWTGGMAFLDYEKFGKSYGKIYKIKITQFKDVYDQENELYNHIILLGRIENIPILTFTAKNKLNSFLNDPSLKYIQVIKDGLKKLNYNLTDNQINDYLKNKNNI